MMGSQGTEGNNHYFRVIVAIDFHRTVEHSAMLINCCPLSISSSLSHSLHLFVFQEWGNIYTHQCRDSHIIKVLFAWLLQVLLYWKVEHHMTQDTGFSESQKEVSFLHGKHILGMFLLPKELFLSKCQEDCCRWKAEEIFKNCFPSHLGMVDLCGTGWGCFSSLLSPGHVEAWAYRGNQGELAHSTQWGGSFTTGCPWWCAVHSNFKLLSNGSPTTSLGRLPYSLIDLNIKKIFNW